MKHQLITMAAWINMDPRRVRLLIMTFIIFMLLLALALPASVSVAGLASGGGD